MSVKMATNSANHHSAKTPAVLYVGTGTQTCTWTYLDSDEGNESPTSPVIGYVSSALVIEYVAPAPAVILPVHSHQLFPVLSTATVATDVNLNITGLMSPQSSGTAVEASAPQAVVSVLPFEEFTGPVYNQDHQEQIVTGEMTLSIVEYPAVQEQAIVPEIPQYVAPAPVIENIAPAPALTSDAHCQQLPPVHTTTTVTTDDNLDMTGLVCPQFSSSAEELSAPHVVDSRHPLEEFTEPVYNQVHQEQIAAGETTENIAEIPGVQEQVIVLENSELQVMMPTHQQIVDITSMENPPLSITADEVGHSSEEVAINTSSTSTRQIDIPSSRSTSTTNDRLDELASMLDSCLTPSASLNEELERLETITKLEPPMLEPSSATSSAKRRRRTRFSPLPGIMEHAVCLAPSAWPPIWHA